MRHMLFLFLLGVLLLPSLVFAQLSTNSTGLDTTAGEIYEISEEELEIGTWLGERIIEPFLGLLGVVFLILVIYGGITWMTAGGNEERVKKAKSLLVHSVIGLFIILLAYGFTQFVFDALT